MPTKSVILIDPRVSNYQLLIDSLTEPAEVIVLDAESDGLSQIAAYLQNRSGIDAIHVISHGSQGALYLGSTMVNSGNLSLYQSQLSTIGSALTERGDILLYGCNVARGDIGVQFNDSLAQYTQADVAASDDATGVDELGGDWELERVSGSVEASILPVNHPTDLLAINTAPTFIVSTGTLTVKVGVQGSYGQALLLQPDGKIVVAGVSIGGVNSNDQFVARFNLDGTLDKTFAIAGSSVKDIATIAGIGKSTDWVVGTSLQSDGKILVAGYSVIQNGDGAALLTLVRYNSNGSIDSSFSDDGLAIYGSSGLHLYGHCVAIEPDGKIVLAGDAMGMQGGYRAILLTRFNIDGSLDATFGKNGVVLDEVNADILGVAVQSDGKTVLVGTANNGNNLESYVCLLRYNLDGTRDASFSGDGVAAGAIAYGNEANSLTLQSDGKILVAGSSYSNGVPKFSVSRFNVDGTLDTGFSGGVVITDFDSSIAYSVCVQPNGKLLVTGTAYGAFATARYNSDGSLDTSFSSDGKVTTDFGAFGDTPKAVAVQSDGSILAIGSAFAADSTDTFNGGHYETALARYLANGNPDTSFNLNQSLGGTVSFVEKGQPIALDSTVMVRDSELLSSGTYSGATVTLTRHGGAKSEDEFSASGNLGTLIEGSVLTLSGAIVGSVTRLSGGILSIKFSSRATQSVVDETLSSLKYANKSDSPSSSIQIDWIFSDGNSGAQGTGGALIATGSTTVNITLTNDTPTGTNGKAFVQKNSIYALHASDFGFFDAEDGKALSAVQISSLPAKGTFQYDGANLVAGVDISAQDLASDLLTFTPDASASGANYASFQFKVKDSGGLYDPIAKVLALSVNAPPTGSVTISGVATQGRVLNAANTLADLDGIGSVSYQWQLAGVNIVGATASSFTLTQAEVGKIISVKASYTDGLGATESVLSTATSAIGNVNDVPTGKVLIAGTAILGEILTVSTTLADLDGMGTISYQWLAGGVNVAGATSSTFSITQTVVGKSIAVSASYTDGFGTMERINSIATAVVTDPANPTQTGTAANESFYSGKGNDTIDGAGGTDTAIYTGKITDYFIKYNRALGTATITDHRANADGTDSLKSIEKLQFADKTFDLLNPPRTESAAFGKSQSFLFDPAYYLLKHPDLVPTVTLATAFDSYKTTAAQGAAPNAWFDPVYYANRWADLKALNLDAVTLFAHYNLYGVWEGRSAGPTFDKYDGTRYLKDNPDVAAYVDAYVADFLGSRSNGAIAHYVIYGAAEGRVAYDTAGVAIEQAILIGVPG
jgi:uncharacterized delta-60 repeat protein